MLTVTVTMKTMSAVCEVHGGREGAALPSTGLHRPFLFSLIPLMMASLSRQPLRLLRELTDVRT